MASLLDGIQVIDWGVLQVGPYAAAMLADLGADVIHLEEPEQGDLLRGLIKTRGIQQLLPNGHHINFEEHNRNKRGIASDLRSPRGKEIMYRLVAKSDVFITNFRQKAVKKLGMDYETLSRYN